eukprot:TRINITY_DN20309_c0_g1_i1.p1 TRINITY_DN20309_c0_g1~~TRINITY_DN20309_c0_g1_i1.p1  ORF type:complete len:291 (+),score=56.76 TRINITY_DN20309_c0_g1_i1:63-875(+)
MCIRDSYYTYHNLKEDPMEPVMLNGVTYNPKELAYYQTKFTGEDDQLVYDDYKYANYKYLAIDMSEHKDLLGRSHIVLYQDFRLNKGGIFWDGSYILIRYFLDKYQPTLPVASEVKVLELGAGTALPGIITALLGYQTTFTDLEYLMPFVKKNCELNFDVNKDNVEIATLEWGVEEQMKKIRHQRFDVIFGSELIYLDETFEDLVKTLEAFSDEKTIIVFSYKFRMREKLELFFSIFQRSFTYEYVDNSELQKYHPNKEEYVFVAKKIVK